METELRWKNKERGLKGENYFLSLANQNGVPARLIDDWYDFQVYDKIPVEVKSCQISIRKGDHISVGRFTFVKSHLEQLREAHGWVCLLVRHYDQFLLYGFVRASQLSKIGKYLTLHKARELAPFTFNDWIEEVHKQVEAAR